MPDPKAPARLPARILHRTIYLAALKAACSLRRRDLSRRAGYPYGSRFRAAVAALLRDGWLAACPGKTVIAVLVE